MLLAGGANVNEQNNDGVSCLASTAGDLDLVQLLLDHDVEIKADAILMSVHSRRADVLNALVKAGANPNMTVEAEQGLHQDLPLLEEYPLYHAATRHGAQNCRVLDDSKDIRWSQTVELMQRLLSSGADPYATFQRWTPLSLEEDDKEGEDVCAREILREGRILRIQMEEVVLVHELLEQKDMVHPILGEMAKAGYCCILLATITTSVHPLTPCHQSPIKKSKNRCHLSLNVY